MSEINNLSRKNRRVLVIDDNQAIHEDFSKILGPSCARTSALDHAEVALFGAPRTGAAAGDFQLDSALQGREGLERVRQALAAGTPYAMAFIDVRMPPGWDGIETTARIWEVDADLQVVICTAYSDYSWDELIAKVGQSDRLVILKKPFDNIEVLQLANALTEKWSLIQQVRHQIDDLEAVVGLRTAELRKSEEQFRLIAENVADLIAVVGVNGRRLYSSPSYQRLLGYTPPELEDSPVHAQVHPEDRARVAEAEQACLSSGAGQMLEYRVQHKDGSWRVLESHGRAVRNARGEVERLVVVARDITGRKQAEQERHSMELQLRHVQKLESIGELAAGIAHEINTPTQFIGDNLRFLQDGFGDLHKALEPLSSLVAGLGDPAAMPGAVVEINRLLAAADLPYLFDEMPKAIRQSLEGVERVANIVKAMKDFSHPDGAEMQPLDLNHAVESTLTVARNEWRYVADVHTKLEAGLPRVHCFAGDINQVLLNLIVNAAHAIAETPAVKRGGKGAITITTRRDGEWVEVAVADTGTGIPENVRSKIFDPFFTTKPVGKGTGQGLFITHNVVVGKHGGSIAVDTEPGRGTTFRIRLRIDPPAAKSQRAA